MVSRRAAWSCAVFAACQSLCSGETAVAQRIELVPAPQVRPTTPAVVDAQSNILVGPRGTAPEVIAPPLSESSNANRAAPQSLDAELLIVDEQFRQGFRSGAARRYATLSQRFLGEPRLLARRFVAQVASGQFRQAVVISSLAGIFEQKIAPEQLPGGMLDGLGLEPEEVMRITEQVARQALAANIDAATLDAVATWLSLAGEQKSSVYFQSQAEALRKSERVILRPEENSPIVLGESVPPPRPVAEGSIPHQLDPGEIIVLEPPLEFEDL